MIKNPKLRRTIGGTKSDDKPEMYSDSKLFTRKHPRKEGSQYKALEEVPDPQFENIQPEEEERPVKKSAVDILKSLMKAEPDTTGKLEGKFSIPLNQMIGWLNRIVAAEYSQWLRYYHYSIVMRSHYRDALAEEFLEHADQELGHLDAVALRVVGLGGYPLPAIERPAPLKKIEDILKELLRHEQEGMNLYRKVLSFCGDNEGTRQILETNIANEQEHIDELWRYLKNPEEINKADMSAGRDTMPSDKQRKREYDHSFARQPQGESGQPTPDLPDRGRDWHGTVPGVPDEPQDDDKDQEESENYFKDPKNLLQKERSKSPNEEAMKALAGAARFSSGPVMPPRERDFMLQNGYTEEEIREGAQMTPRLRAEFNRFVANSVHKSLSVFDKFGR